MTDQLIKIISEELLKPTFEMTKQYLDILQVEYLNNRPIIEGTEVDKKSNQAKAYVKVKDESFYLQFVFDIDNEIELLQVDTSPFISISFTPTSEELTLEYLLSLTKLKPTRTISKGDFFSNGKFQYSYNGLEFNTYSEPGRLDTKMNYLLEILEDDIDGIRELTKQTNCSNLFITIVHHIGNGNFTGLYLDKETINRVSKLGMELTFDIYSTGERIGSK